MASETKNHALIAYVKAKSQVAIPWDEEFERMLSGMDFSATRSGSMSTFKVFTLRLLQTFNNLQIPLSPATTMEDIRSANMAIARQFLGKLGVETIIQPPFFCTWGFNIFLGEKIYFNRGVEILDSSVVVIGSGTIVGPGVRLCCDMHEVEPEVRKSSKGYTRPIYIGETCWLGMGVQIVGGVTIGNGVTVAAGGVVNRDVEDNVLVGGVPAKIIKYLANHPRFGQKPQLECEDALHNGPGNVRKEVVEISEQLKQAKEVIRPPHSQSGISSR